MQMFLVSLFTISRVHMHTNEIEKCCVTSTVTLPKDTKSQTLVSALKFPHLKCHPMERCFVKCYLDKQGKYNIGDGMLLPSNTRGGGPLCIVCFHPFVLFTTVTTNHAVVIGIQLCFVFCRVSCFL